MALLITGGCGYIGSHIVVTAALQGMRVITLDLSMRVPQIFRELGIIAVQGDCGDALLVRTVCRAIFNYCSNTLCSVYRCGRVSA